MTPRGYREEELVSNRASLLLAGGSEDERRAWAEEARAHFAHEGPLVEVRQPAELAAALRAPRGVVFVPDALKLGLDAQAQLMRCLQQQEERPKLVIGLPGTVDVALARGTLRDDLHYRLHQAQVDLATEGLREVLRRRREKAAAELARQREKAAAELARQREAEAKKAAALAAKRLAAAPARKPASAKAAAAKSPKSAKPASAKPAAAGKGAATPARASRPTLKRVARR